MPLQSLTTVSLTCLWLHNALSCAMRVALCDCKTCTAVADLQPSNLSKQLHSCCAAFFFSGGAPLQNPKVQLKDKTRTQKARDVESPRARLQCHRRFWCTPARPKLASRQLASWMPEGQKCSKGLHVCGHKNCGKAHPLGEHSD